MDVSSILTNVVAPIIIVGLPLLAFCYIAYDVIRKIRRKAFIAAFDAAHAAKNTDRLIEYLQDWETAERAGRTLEEIGQPAVEPLIAALQSPTPLISNGAAYLLGRIKDQRALEPLSQILRSSNETKISASFALGEMGNPIALEPLFETATREANADVRVAAGQALFQLGDSRARDVLIEALRLDPSWPYTASAVHILGKIGDPKTVPMLISYLGYWRDDVQSAAAEALAGMGEPAFNALMALIVNPNERNRPYACYALGIMGNERALPELERLAREDKNRQVRVAAEYAMKTIKEKTIHTAVGGDWNAQPAQEAASIAISDQPLEKNYPLSLFGFVLGVLAVLPYLYLLLTSSTSSVPFGGSIDQLFHSAGIFSGAVCGIYGMDTGLKEKKKTLLTFAGLLLCAGGMFGNFWFIFLCQFC